MRTYSREDAEVIFLDHGGQWLELKADGVHLRNKQLQFDPTQALHWKYVCELDGADSPNPLTAPCLPFPFTANQLAAFMLDGVGAVIPSVYGNWENGPDQGMLDSMGVLAREPRRAMTEAYTAYMTAQGAVGPCPSSLEKRVGRLAKIHSYRNGKANKHEGVFADGITSSESRTRRERAVASNLELWTQLNSARNEYEAAFNGWRNAMVRQLLQPAPALNPATPAPVVAAQRETTKAGPVPVATRAMADSFAGLHWDGEQWIKKLGDMTVWLEACLVLNRGRGEGMRLWNPVLIGSYLVRMGHAKTNSVRAKFQTQPALKQWLDEWKTYEADNHPTD